MREYKKREELGPGKVQIWQIDELDKLPRAEFRVSSFVVEPEETETYRARVLGDFPCGEEDDRITWGRLIVFAIIGALCWYFMLVTPWSTD